MSVILFILVLVALIVAHEFGHFVVAKLSGMRVDEFGIGYPPRAWGFKKGGTEYTLNWIPFGGFVRIYGEDANDASGGDAFSARPKILQALTLVAGIAMNLLFAYVLIVVSLGLGTQRALTDEEAMRDPNAVIAVADVLPGSPAAEAGFMPGDLIRSVEGKNGTFTGAGTDAFTAYVADDRTLTPLTFEVERNNEPITIVATPQSGVIAAEPWRIGLGVAVSSVGTVAVTWYEAPIQGAVLTWELTKQTAIGLAHFFGGIFTFSTNLAQVTGPIGIAGAVGSAADNGLTALLVITAIISINLALINLIPIPALDGGRLLFVLIETVTRRPINAGVGRTVNTIGFAFLILLMIVVSAHDVFKLFA
ncbi:MAG: RIP metalloprotease RseP [Parcubacteria bacterium C7867-007]|nr:MAG: RIP metalloprotease RseP [Parcubacteria bacterium C7867-007]